jgi:hypothetical protein
MLLIIKEFEEFKKDENFGANDEDSKNIIKEFERFSSS